MSAVIRFSGVFGDSLRRTRARFMALNEAEECNNRRGVGGAGAGGGGGSPAST